MCVCVGMYTIHVYMYVVCINEYQMIHLTREVWPDDVFGTEGIDVVEQRDILKKIFLDPVSGLCVCVVCV